MEMNKIYVPELGYMDYDDAQQRIIDYVKSSTLSYDIKECLLSLCSIEYRQEIERLEEDVHSLRQNYEESKEDYEELKDEISWIFSEIEYLRNDKEEFDNNIDKIKGKICDILKG